MAVHCGDNEMKKYLTSVGILVWLLCAGCELGGQSSTEVVRVRDWSPLSSVQLMVASFTKAKVDPDVTPDLVPDPDPAKCPCKGTGIITHGDGHTTSCPYHGEDSEPDKPDKPDKSDKSDKPVEPRKCRCDTKDTYCNCVATYDKCSCAPRMMNTSTTLRPKRPSFLQRIFSPFTSRSDSSRSDYCRQ